MNKKIIIQKNLNELSEQFKNKEITDKEYIEKTYIEIEALKKLSLNIQERMTIKAYEKVISTLKKFGGLIK